MRRQGKPEPWIENLILNYGMPEDERGGIKGQLKAYVVSVGQMSSSQAQRCKGPLGLLFLSDGEFKIPAVLSPSAWEHLQEQEERECLTSLLNNTVLLQNYSLDFHMSQEQTKCRFYLSVGKLVTTAAGPVKENTPCYTTLPFVRMKIYKTWMSLLGQEDCLSSQSGFDLSDLLGEWQHDCLQGVIEDVKTRLTTTISHPILDQPFTQNSTSSLTGWDLDRIRFKGEKSFFVPVECLLIPEKNVQHLPGDGMNTERESAPASPSADEPQTSESAGVETMWDTGDDSLVHMIDAVVPGITDQIPSNPWDMFPAPSVSSCPDSSPETCSEPVFKLGTVTVTTSTQLPSKETSSIPPYQKPQSNLLTTSPTPASLLGSSPSKTHQANPLTPEPPQSIYKKPKRKRSEDENEETSPSPPSWLFDSQKGSPDEEESGSTRPVNVQRNTPTTHRDGQPFSYSYKVTGQNLQDFSYFKVATSYLPWAVRYLLTPKPNTGQPDKF